MDIVEVKDASDLKMMRVRDVMGKSIISMNTTEDRIYAYKNAETIVDSYIERERNGAVSKIRADALRMEKESIMGAELWRENLNKVPQDLVDRWYKFLSQIDELDKDGRESRQVRRLMVFANYTETEKLNGIKIIAPTETQLRKISNLMNSNKKKASIVTVAKMYEKLAKESNDGKVFGSSTDVEKAYVAYHEEPIKEKKKKKDKKKKKEVEEVEEVYVRDVFAEAAGDCPPRGGNSLKLGSAVLAEFPTMSEDEWKKWYRKVASILHPDKGGSEQDMTILTAINNMVNVVVEANKLNEKNSQWEDDYEQWKKDHNYNSDFVPEDEL